MASLQDIAREQQRLRAAQREKTEAARKSALTAAAQLSSSLHSSVRREVDRVEANQQAIDEQARQLLSESETFSSETGRWLQAFDELHQAMSQLANLDSWAESVEARLESVTENLETLTGA
mmetsp:Transcript_1176/g.3593  ORF Transcript_1176/g.3593 Transcript_1176/m.3593 type:complete len:121 (+) Transcript_1176:82-444(+)